MYVFGTRMRERRKKKRLSMEKLGKLLGVATSTVAGYESGFRNPSLETLAAIATHLDVTTDYLLGLTDDPERRDAKADATRISGLHWNGDELSEEELDLIYGVLRKALLNRKTRRGEATRANAES